MILYHAITCDEDECDPPRTVDNAPRLPAVLNGCPIGDPIVHGGVVSEGYLPLARAAAYAYSGVWPPPFEVEWVEVD